MLSTTFFSNMSQLFKCTHTHIHTGDQMKTIRSQVPRNPRSRAIYVFLGLEAFLLTKVYLVLEFTFLFKYSEIVLLDYL